MGHYQRSLVLCIEDEPIIRAGIVEELSAVGYRVIEAANGEEGLASILRNKPELVLCDITMPVMSGFEMLLNLRKNHKEFDDMPLVFVSALAERKNVIEGMRIGGDDYLTKPLDFEKLLATVHARLNQVGRMNASRKNKPTLPDVLDGMACKVCKSFCHPKWRNIMDGPMGSDCFFNWLQQAMDKADEAGEDLSLFLLEMDNSRNAPEVGEKDSGYKLKETVHDRLCRFVENQAKTVIHFGHGDCATILSTSPAHGDAGALASRLFQAMAEPPDKSPDPPCVTSSLGIAIRSTMGIDAVALFKNALNALLRAKRDEGNSFHIHDPKSSTEESWASDREEEMRNALERGEFVLYYQPRILARSERVSGVEALIRRRNGKNALIPPSEFIPMAEETGFIIPLGDWVIREACRKLKVWRGLFRSSLTMAVNVSVAQFEQPDFVKKISRILSEEGVEPEWFELEITESKRPTRIDMLLHNLRSLREMGFSIAIDDFGTGHSSFLALKRFPANILKIDRSFVRNVHDSPEDAKIVNATIKLAHAFGLKVVAEGVEIEEQQEYLRNNDCDELQGNFILPAVSSAEFVEFVKSH